MATICRIVDNDSVGTRVQLSDGSFGIVAHGQASPSIGQEVEATEGGYLRAIEGTRPHQTVDISQSLHGIPEPENSALIAALIGNGGKEIQPIPPEFSNAEYIRQQQAIEGEAPDAVDPSGSVAKDEDRDNSEEKTDVG